MARLSALLTFALGCVVGYVLYSTYPLLHVWTRTFTHQDNTHVQVVKIPSTVNSRSESIVTKYNRSQKAEEDASLKPTVDHVPSHKVQGPSSSEYKILGQLFIGVLTTEKYLLTRAKTIHETWARELDTSSKLVFFVASTCNTSHPDLKHMNIVRLENVSDVVYPPQRKQFAAVKHMYRFHGNNYKWFIRADDDVYIRISTLMQFLKRFNFNDKIYLGRPGEGKNEDRSRLKFMSNEHYCMGGPGVVLSKATLNELGPQLDSCLMAIDRHNKAVTSKAEIWYDDDAELGRCISRTLGIQCSSFNEVKNYFIHDYNSHALEPTLLWRKEVFKNLITVHPIKQPEHMYNVHLYYTVIKWHMAQDNVTTAENNIKELCTKIPRKLLLTNKHICPTL